MDISESEYLHVAQLSAPDAVVQATFGPNGMSLIDSPGNRWAIDEVLRLRAAKALGEK